MHRQTYFVNFQEKRYFFSTNHSQQVEDGFIPVSVYTSPKEIRQNMAEDGCLEMLNPNSEYQRKDLVE